MKLLSTVQLLLLAAVAQASHVVDLTPKNFEEVVLKSGVPSLVEFYAPWCGHCKTLAPTWEELATNFSPFSKKLTIGKVDGDAHKTLSSQYKIGGFPTLKFFDGKGGEPIPYESGRDLESLTKFITEQTKLKPKVKKDTPSKVVVLTDDNFSKIAEDQDKDVFVKFYAPWCGHCKTLAPIYDKVATDYVLDTNVVIAKVDCDAPNGKKTGEKYGIQGFPTLKFFPKGSATPIEYEGGRSEADILEFINKHAGTHRVPGGGLNDKAGTIEALDTLLLGKLPSGLKDIVVDLKTASVDLKDKYVSYYLKVAEKMGSKASYVEDELTRLKNIIAKGNLAPEKLDDLTIRSNILQKFMPTPSEDEPIPAEPSPPQHVKDEL